MLSSRSLSHVVAVAALLGACSSGGTSAPSTTPPSAPTAAVAPTSAPGAVPAAPPTETTANPPTATPTPTPPVAHQHRRCGWIGADNAAVGAASFAANADFFDAIHPVWFTARADGTITANSTADDATVVATARAHAVDVMPLIYGGDDASVVRSIIGSPATTAAHVANLVSLVQSHNYDGIEIDYEHLWSAADRAPYVAFLTQLATAMHAVGKTVSLAASLIDVDNGQNAYDYAALVAGGVDIVHLMAYDFHAIDSDHRGPLAPLGWIDATGARLARLAIADHFILGVANYGVGSGWYETAGLILADCQPGTYSNQTDHMTSCSYGHYAAGQAPHCTTSRGEIWFDDSGSVGEKAANARSHGLRGVSYYTLGNEPAGYFDALRAAYP